jgi:hypothetical protein
LTVSARHVGAGRHLGQRVGLDRAVVARRHLGGQLLAAGRVDALADDAERAVEADGHLLLGRAEDGLRHGVSNSFNRAAAGRDVGQTEAGRRPQLRSAQACAEVRPRLAQSRPRLADPRTVERNVT